MTYDFEQFSRADDYYPTHSSLHDSGFGKSSPAGYDAPPGAFCVPLFFMSSLFTNILKDIARQPVMEIILLLKKQSGMAVNELSAALGMSYMGTKQHCVFLEKHGYLDTERRSNGMGGRPEKVYRLTHKLGHIFPRCGSDIAIDILEATESVYGATSIEPLLRQHFSKRIARYQVFLSGRNLLERAQSLARLRTIEGCMSHCEFDPHKGLGLVEYHSPIVEIARRYPVIYQVEAEALGRVLGCTVKRVEFTEEAFSRIEFRMRSLDASGGNLTSSAPMERSSDHGAQGIAVMS